MAVGYQLFLSASWKSLWFWSGLRGAIAFALSLHLELAAEKRYVLVTTTLIIVLFTLMILGGSTMPLLKVCAVFVALCDCCTSLHWFQWGSW